MYPVGYTIYKSRIPVFICSGLIIPTTEHMFIRRFVNFLVQRLIV